MFGKVEVLLRTFSLLKGLPVVDINIGKILGKVSDLTLSDNGEVKSLIVEPKRLFNRKRTINLLNISSFGHDGVMVNSRNLSINSKKDNHYLCHYHGLLGKWLYSTEGEKLGILNDVYFDENLGTILGYEVSEGFFADISEGKKIIYTSSPLQFGEDMILIELDT
jgi:uncharacterized protein YrrD